MAFFMAWQKLSEDEPIPHAGELLDAAKSAWLDGENTVQEWWLERQNWRFEWLEPRRVHAVSWFFIMVTLQIHCWSYT